MSVRNAWPASVVSFVVVLCSLILQNGNSVRAQTTGSRPTVAAFFNAIAIKDTNAAFEMLERNTNLVRAVDNFSKLPLLEGAASGNLPLVKRLIELGADINVRGDTMMSVGSESTALHIAIRHNQAEVCKWLLEAGADPNMMAFGFTTPLHLAFAEGREDMAGWLLDYGADPFQAKGYTNDKLTPFEVAITRGSGKLVPRMLQQDRRNLLGTKSHAQSITSNSRIEFEKAAAKILVERGARLLAAAVQRGELEAAQALIKAGVTAKGTDERSEPLLRGFALWATEAAKDRQAAIEQLKQTFSQIKGVDTNTDAQFLVSLHSQEVAQAAMVESSDPERIKQIRDLLIKHGAVYDAFAATALGDIERARKLVTVDKTVIQAKDRDGETPLHWSVRTDQLPLTSFWIGSGVSLAATNSAGQTALHLAAAKGLVGQITMLLAAQAPTNVRDNNGRTPLDSAIQTKQSASISLLLGYKPALSRPERAVSTTLHKAAASGNLVELSALMETATNLEARNELGLTPLQVAVQQGHFAAAALLLDKGADAKARDPGGNTLLHQIFLQDRQLTVYDRPPTNWLARMGSDPRKATYLKYLTVGRYEQGPNPILQAASFLLACGLDATATNRAGQTVIQLATDEKTTRRLFFFDDDEAVLLKLLGTGGANVNQGDENGDTALHRAGQVTLADRAASLIASGADVNATNHQGRTPLHKFAEQIGGWDLGDGSNQPFQLLLKSKPKVNAQDNDGLTPLHVLALADTSFKKEATKALLDAGADPSLRDKQGRTPAHLFLSGKWPWRDATPCIQMLVKAGANLSAKDDEGKTPLHYFAALGSQRPMFFIRGIDEMFLKAKVDIKVRDNEGNTPLHAAARTGTRDVFDWLVKQGADLDDKNHRDESPRLLAARTADRFTPFRFNSDTDISQAVREGKTESVAALLKADPKLLNQTNELGQTPLRVAVVAHRTNMLEFLDQNGARWDAVSSVIAGRAEKLREVLSSDPSAATSSLYGRSLLHLTAARGDVEMTRILLDSHSSLVAQDERGLSPLGDALLQGRTDVVVALRQRGATENIFDAIYNNNLTTTKALLSKDESFVRATNAAGMSLVEIASGTDHADILKLLLDKGGSAASINVRDGRTPLHAAAIYNCTNTAAMLIRRGAKVEVTDKHGFTPLHLAAMRGSVQTAALLLKHKAGPNSRISSLNETPSAPMRLRISLAGCTPLHLAALTGQTDVIQLLLESGAAINATNSTGSTALDLAGRQGLPTETIWMQAGLTRMRDLTGSEPSAQRNSTASLFERQNVAARMLEKSGGQHSPLARPGAGRP